MARRRGRPPMRLLAFVLALTLLPVTAFAVGPAATLLVASDGPLGVPHGSRTTCTVAATGQTLKAALDGAVADGCLPAVAYITYSFGRFVECIGAVCNDYGLAPFSVDGRFWILYENGASASEGVDGLRVDAGDAFAVSYDRCPFVACVPTYAVP